MEATRQPAVTLKRINDALTVVVVLLAIYIITAPFLPQISWWIRQWRSPDNTSISQVSTTAPIPKDDLLLIPRLHMKQAIHTGASIYELNKGVWLIPKTSTPDKASNTVMAGHRFTYAGPAVFYFLDKVKMNDPIVIDWQGTEYVYKVKDIQEVPPTDIAVQNPTPKPTLTLYTCTPLWTARDRLIVTSELVRQRK